MSIELLYIMALKLYYVSKWVTAFLKYVFPGFEWFLPLLFFWILLITIIMTIIIIVVLFVIIISFVLLWCVI